MNKKGTVYPVFDNEFKIGTKGLASEQADMAVIEELENFAPSIDGGVEEWNAMEDGGWGNAMMTSKKLQMFEILFSKKDRKKIDEMNLSFKDLRVLIETATEMVTDSSEEEVGE